MKNNNTSNNLSSFPSILRYAHLLGQIGNRNNLRKTGNTHLSFTYSWWSDGRSCWLSILPWVNAVFSGVLLWTRNVVEKDRLEMTFLLKSMCHILFAKIGTLSNRGRIKSLHVDSWRKVSLYKISEKLHCFHFVIRRSLSRCVSVSQLWHSILCTILGFWEKLLHF